MAKQKINLNREVTALLDSLKHPFRKEIELVRNYILSTDKNLTENIKWNGSNYCIDNKDRITITALVVNINYIFVVCH
ncbi:hypothetical protein Q4Q35_02145 [Flavivirga aquimarina]|uniref:DUF1801 domain-containing protein n=1 Tax=Flavivirga aquimarina TaxID=2027862 RepID=A0ABT8W650_9FLAO|nr:hypothetical protein [Flavivirga aquimarina]